ALPGVATVDPLPPGGDVPGPTAAGRLEGQRPLPQDADRYSNRLDFFALRPSGGVSARRGLLLVARERCHSIFGRALRIRFALAPLGLILRLIALLDHPLLLRFQPCNCFRLCAGILLPFFFDFFYSFFDPRDSQCDFFLLLLKLLKRHDLIAQFGKIGRLRSAFASEVDFTFLEKALLVAKRDACSLAPDLQPDLAKACPDETHTLT